MTIPRHDAQLLKDAPEAGCEHVKLVRQGYLFEGRMVYRCEDCMQAFDADPYDDDPDERSE